MPDLRDYLHDRGLGENVVRVPGSLYGVPLGEIEQPNVSILTQMMPPDDYQVRVMALRMAIKSAFAVHPSDSHRIMQRALDFHVFLMGTSTKGKGDE